MFLLRKVFLKMLGIFSLLLTTFLSMSISLYLLAAFLIVMSNDLLHYLRISKEIALGYFSTLVLRVEMA
jgi:hypothetical protein